jgi:hypothetical protein
VGPGYHGKQGGHSQRAGHGQSSAAPTGAAGSRIVIRTVPALPGVRFIVQGHRFASNKRGVAVSPPVVGSAATLRVVNPGEIQPGVRATFSRWGDDHFKPVRTIVPGRRASRLEVGFEMTYLVRERFVDLNSRPVSPHRVLSVSLTSTLGSRDKFSPGNGRWLIGSRVARRANGLESTQIQYSVDNVVVDGANVVHHAQQRFFPSHTRDTPIKLLLYSARIRARDLVFRQPTGTTFILKYPNGTTKRLRFGRDSEILLPALARGTYGLRVEAGGYSPAVPLAVSKNQDVTLRVITNLDLIVLFGGFGSACTAMLLLRRPGLRRRLRGGRRRTAAAAAVAAAIFAAGHPQGAAARGPQSPTPVLAYYYIWFDPSSWLRAKSDYPLLGRYSSDDASILRRHVDLAKRSGIDGFLVSWKSTPTLDRRLAKLVDVADRASFRLGIIYQGLDFSREPLPAARVGADLERFAARYAQDPAFRLFAKPLVIWSGSWRFSRREVAEVTSRVRDRLYVLASEKTAAGYERLASVVDGDAYYWSSVDPRLDHSFGTKLTAMGAAVHARGGLWIPPAAPGFDARLLGGHRVVPRADGATLRTEFNAAEASSPDGIGLISWNEFSENSQIEPSRRYGDSSLKVLRDLSGTRFANAGEFDSSDTPTTNIGYGLPLIVGIAGVLLTGVGAAFWRRAVRRVSLAIPEAGTETEGERS